MFDSSNWLRSFSIIVNKTYNNNYNNNNNNTVRATQLYRQ